MNGHRRIVNLYAGPGTGKSTTAAALFAELKYRGHNVELVTEYAKDATWEKRSSKLFEAQEYIFGKQHFRICRVIDEVELVITDSPLLLSLAYIPDDYYLKSLPQLIIEAHKRYETLDVFLIRNPAVKAFQQAGRNQDEEGARELDSKIKRILVDNEVSVMELLFDRTNVEELINEIYLRGWL